MQLRTIVTLLISIVADIVYGKETCVCTRETSRHYYGCMDISTDAGVLFSDYYGDPCLLKAYGVNTHGTWVAGISEFSEVVYMIHDYSVYEMPCDLRRGRKVTFNPKCPPSMNGGQTLNPLPSTTSTTTTPTPPTTTTTTTTPSTTTSTTTTPTTTTTTPPQVTITAITGQTSKKCEFQQTIIHARNGNSIFHPDGNPCPMGGNPPESLLYSICKPPDTDYYNWPADQKVVDVCGTLLPGEPIGYFANNNPLGYMGIFISCLPGGASFSVAMQKCGGVVEVKKISNLIPGLKPEYFFTFQW